MYFLLYKMALSLFYITCYIWDIMVNFIFLITDLDFFILIFKVGTFYPKYNDVRFDTNYTLSISIFWNILSTPMVFSNMMMINNINNPLFSTHWLIHCTTINSIYKVNTTFYKSLHYITLHMLMGIWFSCAINIKLHNTII